MKKTIILILATLSYNVLASDVEIQNIRVGGLGCPGHKTQIVYAPDNSTASIIFDRFESHVPDLANTGPKTSRNLNSLNCNMFLTIKLNSDQKLDALEVSYDIRGNAALNAGVIGSFKSYLMSSAGMGTEIGRSRTPQLLQDRSWINSNTEQDEDFLISKSNLIAMNSQCSRNQSGLVQVNLQHQLSTQILKGYENSNVEGTIMVDTSDIKGGIRLRAVTSRCQLNPGQGQGPGRNCRIIRVGGRATQICE